MSISDVAWVLPSGSITAPFSIEKNHVQKVFCWTKWAIFQRLYVGLPKGIPILFEFHKNMPVTYRTGHSILIKKKHSWVGQRSSVSNFFWFHPWVKSQSPITTDSTRSSHVWKHHFRQQKSWLRKWKDQGQCLPGACFARSFGFSFSKWPRVGFKMAWASGNLRVCYWTWPFISWCNYPKWRFYICYSWVTWGSGGWMVNFFSISTWCLVLTLRFRHEVKSWESIKIWGDTSPHSCDPKKYVTIPQASDGISIYSWLLDVYHHPQQICEGKHSLKFNRMWGFFMRRNTMMGCFWSTRKNGCFRHIVCLDGFFLDFMMNRNTTGSSYAAILFC